MNYVCMIYLDYQKTILMRWLDSFSLNALHFAIIYSSMNLISASKYEIADVMDKRDNFVQCKYQICMLSFNCKLMLCSMWCEKNQLISMDVYIDALPMAKQYKNEPYHTWNKMFWKIEVLRNSKFIDLKKNAFLW